MAITTPSGFWKFDESSGNAADSSGNSNTLTNNNTVPYVSGLINNAASLAASGSKNFSITDAAQTNLDPTTGLSVSFWIKFTDSPHNLGEAWGLGQKHASGQASFAIAGGDVANNNQIYFIFTSSGTASDPSVYSEWDSAADCFAAGDAGNWVHIVLVVNAATNTVTLYKNGSSFTITKRTGTATSIFDGTGAFAIGASAVLGGSGTFQVDAYGFWKNYQLTGGEIAELYNSGAGWQYPPTTEYDETYNEALDLTDTVVKATSRTLTQALALTDSIVRSVSRTISEALALADDFLGQKIIPAVLSEALAFTDTVTRSVDAVRMEALALTDTVLKSITRTVSEALALTDTFLSSRVLSTIRTEALALTDTARKSTSRALSEALEMTDTLIAVLGKTFTENLALTDTFSRVWTRVLTLSEAIGLSDGITKLLNGSAVIWGRVARNVATWRRTDRDNP